MMRMDFFVIGTARSGTSSMFQMLRRHPGVWVPDQKKHGGLIKEPKFFGRNWDKGWDWYEEIFGDCPSDKIVGDFTPQYTNSVKQSGPARRISTYFPDARIIYMVRNPIDCALSNWRMRAQSSDEILSFADALEDPQWSVTCFHRVRFFHQIGYFREKFPEDQILVIPLEGIRANPDPWLKRLQKHLGLKQKIREFPHSNKSNNKATRPGIPETTRADRQKFIDMIGEDTHSMLKYMGLPEDYWDLSVDYKGWEPRSS